MQVVLGERCKQNHLPVTAKFTWERWTNAGNFSSFQKLFFFSFSKIMTNPALARVFYNGQEVNLRLAFLRREMLKLKRPRPIKE